LSAPPTSGKISALVATTLPSNAEYSGGFGWHSSDRAASGPEQITVPGSDNPSAGAQSSAPDLAPGTAIGRYMVLGRLGAGAMGVVYAAYDPELDRKVALKLLHPRGHSSLDSRLRLMREAKALARLSHPNVVAVHDVGTYADRVFLAMEFVDGKTLSAWLKEQPQPWEQVVAILRKAGEGLAAAHDAGLVHRDFKPDNVLIARDGRVRVLDFGLARSAGDSSSEDLGADSTPALASVSDSRRLNAELEAAQLTRTGALVGTPAYMSPEQHLGQAANARSDQFSFCVTLYQALYGARPFASDRISGLAMQVLQGKVGAPPAGSAVPTRVRKVVLRGLQADPEQRYPGMPALLAALDHEVRLKRRGGWFIGAGAGLFAFGLAFALRGAAPSDLPPCRNAAARLGDAWSGDRITAIEKAFLTSSLPYATTTWASVRTSLQSYADHWVAMHTEACEANVVRHEQSDALFDRRMRCLDRRRVELNALTEVLARGEASAIEQAGAGVDRLGDIAACGDSVALNALVDPPEGALKAEVDRVAALVAEASALEIAGDWRAAQRLSAEAIADPAATAYKPLAAEALRVHARLQRLDEPTAAVASLLAAVQAAAEGHDDRAAAEAWSDLVFIAGYDLNDAATTTAYASAAGAAVQRVGNDALLTARLDVDLSAAYQRLGETDKALAAGLRALEFFDADPLADPSRRHRVLGNLALIYKARSQRSEARDALTRALELVRQMSGPDHPGAATVLTNLGELALDEGKLDEAREYADEAASIRRRARLSEHISFADSEQLFARIAEARKDSASALAHYRRALDLHTRTQRPSPIKVAALHNDIANLAVGEARFVDAITDYRHALAGFTAVVGPDHVYSLTVEANLADALFAEGRASEALPYQNHVVNVLEREHGPADPETAGALVPRAMSLRALGDPQAALELLERAHSALPSASTDPYDRGRLGLCRYALARSLADLRRDRPRQRQLVLLAEPDLAADEENVFSRRALAELRGWHPQQR
jgi:tetratricopeptide (TPR) repeat protein/tRNA A-37 threonylcarbamoyl transferase component Bud32